MATPPPGDDKAEMCGVDDRAVLQAVPRAKAHVECGPPPAPRRTHHSGPRPPRRDQNQRGEEGDPTVVCNLHAEETTRAYHQR